MVVIAITGVAGVGKTTLAKKLAEITRFKYINILEFAKEKDLIIEYDEAYKTYIVDEDKLIELLSNLIKKDKGDYIIDGNFSHLLPKDLVDLYIVVRTDPNILYKRLKEREYPDYKIFENIWAMNLEIIEDELESEKKDYIVIYMNDEKDLSKNLEEIIKLIRDKQNKQLP